MSSQQNGFDKEKILKEAEKLASILANNHIQNTKKLLKDPSKEFNINPFLVAYLANFLTGNTDPKSLAKAILYPRILGTSITTSFGTQMQSFMSSVLAAIGSTTAGIDIEFVDQLDSRKKWCQLKSGPNTLNKDDVKTIHDHFGSVRRLGRTNNLDIGINDLIVGVIYGYPNDLSAQYKKLTVEHNIPVIIGKEFWHRLTGDENFYSDLINVFATAAKKVDGKEFFEELINDLSETDFIQSLIHKTT